MFCKPIHFSENIETDDCHRDTMTSSAPDSTIIVYCFLLISIYSLYVWKKVILAFILLISSIVT